MDGYIKIFRQIKDWAHFQEPSVLLVWLWLLVSVNFKDGYFHGKLVKKGEIITSFRKISEETGLSVNTIRSCLDKLKMSGEITQRKSENSQISQYTHIVVNQFIKYQSVSMVDTPTDTLVDTPTDTPTDTLVDNNRRKKRKTRKEERNNIDDSVAFATTPTKPSESDFEDEIRPKQSAGDKLLTQQKNCEKRATEFAETLRPFLAEYGREMLNKFYCYWTEVNKSGTKMKFEMEKTWDVAKRLKRWQNNNFNNINLQKNGTNYRKNGLSDQEIFQAVAGGFGLYYAEKSAENQRKSPENNGNC